MSWLIIFINSFSLFLRTCVITGPLRKIGSSAFETELYREAILILSKKLVEGDIDERTFIALRKDVKDRLG
jgi:hypothetical protein